MFAVIRIRLVAAMIIAVSILWIATPALAKHAAPPVVTGASVETAGSRQ